MTRSFRLAALTLALLAASSLAHAQDVTVTLLGTGAPPAAMNRFGPSILVEAGGRRFIFDAGRGALQRLNQSGVGWQQIDGVFFTHLHSDHVVGFPDLWLTGWINPGRDRPLDVWGPRGTAKMTAALEQAYEFDIRIRLYDDRASPDGVVITAHDISPGVVYDAGGVKITAFDVDHAPVRPAFGYRIDHAGRSVVLSGDTRVSDNLIAHARGVDLLVHELVVPASLARAGRPAERARAVVAHHVTPEQAAEVFTRTRPKLAVYSHIVLPDATDEEIVASTRKGYSGAFEVGQDLMVIEVGEAVTVRRPR